MVQASQADHGIEFEFVAELGRHLSDGDFDIPAFPDNAVRITRALEDPEISADQAAKVIGSDPVFSARLLKVANSALLNASGQPISDLRTAVARMGFKQAYNTVMSVAVEQVMHAKTTQRLRSQLEAFWHRSVMVAAYSYVIARKLTKINPDVAMLGGLLHNIGKFYILTESEKYPGFLEDPEALEHVMQEWHGGVGRGILESWGFGEELIKVPDEHEAYHRDTEGVDLVDVVMIASLFSQQIEAEDEYEQNWEDVTAMQHLHLTAADVMEIYTDYHDEIDSMIRALEG